jgi:hypothetical protein
MVHERVDQCSTGMTRRRVDNQAGGFIHRYQFGVLIKDCQGDVVPD